MGLADTIMAWVIEYVERRLRESGVTDRGVGGGTIVGPIPVTSLPSHDHTNAAGAGGQLSGAQVDTFLELIEQGSAPSAPAANRARLYGKDASGQTAPFWRSESGTETNLLTAGGMTNPMTTAQDLIVGGTAGAPGRLGVGSSGHVLQVSSGTVAWGAPPPSAFVANGPLTLLDDTTLGSPAASWSSPTIPSGYVGLVLAWSAGCSTSPGSNTLKMQINADGGSNYDNQVIEAWSGTMNPFEALAANHIRVGYVADASITNVFNAGVVTLWDIASTSHHKTAWGTMARKDGTATGNIVNNSFAGHWRSTAAITGLSLAPNSGSFATGSRFTLYGVRAAADALVGARAYHDANQSINDTSATVLALNSERYDVLGFHSTVSNTSRLTVPTGYGGTYAIGASVTWEAAAASGVVRVELLVDGTTVIARDQRPGAAVETATTISADYALTAGQYVECRVYQTTGAARNILAAGNYSPEVWLHRIE